MHQHGFQAAGRSGWNRLASAVNTWSGMEPASHQSTVGSQPVLTWVTAMRLLPGASRGASSVPVSALHIEAQWFRSHAVRVMIPLSSQSQLNQQEHALLMFAK